MLMYNTKDTLEPGGRFVSSELKNEARTPSLPGPALATPPAPKRNALACSSYATRYHMYTVIQIQIH